MKETNADDIGECLFEIVDVTADGRGDHLQCLDEPTVGESQVDGRDVLRLQENVVQLLETVANEKRVVKDRRQSDRRVLEEEMLAALDLFSVEPDRALTKIVVRLLEELVRVVAILESFAVLLEECVDQRIASFAPFIQLRRCEMLVGPDERLVVDAYSSSNRWIGSQRGFDRYGDDTLTVDERARHRCDLRNSDARFSPSSSCGEKKQVLSIVTSSRAKKNKLRSFLVRSLWM